MRRCAQYLQLHFYCWLYFGCMLVVFQKYFIIHHSVDQQLVHVGSFSHICGNPSVNWIISDACGQKYQQFSLLVCFFCLSVSRPFHWRNRTDALRYSLSDPRIISFFIFFPFFGSMVGTDVNIFLLQQEGHGSDSIPALFSVEFVQRTSPLTLSTGGKMVEIDGGFGFLLISFVLKQNII